VVIDCGTCVMRDISCTDCVVSVLLGPPGVFDLQGPEQTALAVLADSGLVPPLRLVRRDDQAGRRRSA
jgi:hypothetical protein